jgi:hypothetical protein
MREVAAARPRRQRRTIIGRCRIKRLRRTQVRRGIMALAVRHRAWTRIRFARSGSSETLGAGTAQAGSGNVGQPFYRNGHQVAYVLRITRLRRTRARRCRGVAAQDGIIEGRVLSYLEGRLPRTGTPSNRPSCSHTRCSTCTATFPGTCGAGHTGWRNAAFARCCMVRHYNARAVPDRQHLRPAGLERRPSGRRTEKRYPTGVEWGDLPSTRHL